MVKSSVVRCDPDHLFWFLRLLHSGNVLSAEVTHTAGADRQWRQCVACFTASAGQQLVIYHRGLHDVKIKTSCYGPFHRLCLVDSVLLELPDADLQYVIAGTHGDEAKRMLLLEQGIRGMSVTTLKDTILRVPAPQSPYGNSFYTRLIKELKWRVRGIGNA